MARHIIGSYGTSGCRLSERHVSFYYQLKCDFVVIFGLAAIVLGRTTSYSKLYSL